MTLPNALARPARGILWVGFFFLILALCFLNGIVPPVLAATSQDDPPYNVYGIAIAHGSY